MKKVRDYNHACEVLGLDPEAKPEVSKLREKDQKAFIALHELTIIVEAQNKLNEWELDWTNNHQGKYYPWFDVEVNEKGSGVGLSYYGYLYSGSGTGVGSRLVVGTWQEAEYIGNQFLAQYEDWLIK